MTLQACVLLVEDEQAISSVVRYNLESEGFRVLEASDGDEALAMVRDERPDLVVLDWMLPSISGLEVCRSIRRNKDFKQLPIIMLTARAEEEDRIRGLDSGADDYVTKPFSPSELVARVRALLRRSRPALSDDKLAYADVEMELDTFRVRRAGRQIHLGPTEFRLLRVYSREQLLDAVWGRDIFIESRTVDVHIRRLRKALNGPGEPDLIRTVRSAGYALESAIISDGETTS